MTIDVSDITTKDNSNIEKFIYIINGEEKEETNFSTYKLTDLNLNTKYEIKVIAKDKQGKQKQSKIIEYTTSSKQYVYNYGKEYEELTGGWIKGASYSGGYGDKKEDYLYINCPDERNVFTTYIFRTMNKIDISKFSSMHVNIELTNYNDNGGAQYTLGTYLGENSYYGSSQIAGVIPDNYIAINSNCKELDIFVELKEKEKLEFVYACLSAGGLGAHATMCVYQIWFE